ncbi:peptide-binding protein [Alkalicoccobacillus murimartini]|uniref:Peptide/nickel transport system substrate-binding protein n=1 Tax=Alkalicoccobacillus murimartini TaxID=171685 RepID=A0ABT9YG32_9BACI|nr:peptide-binding protein [Alkalicoccobacillus murimartini]MDQ0206780.1 peptide/nickel transport system substrate-binding protein [Alkalicoccobacillus murimartini]
MKNKNVLYVLSGALSLGLVLGACSGDSVDSPSSTGGGGGTSDGGGSEEQGGPVEGGNVNLAMFSPPENLFNPIFYTALYDAHILDITHEALVTQDEEFTFIPKLAEGWEFSDDNTELTYTLREDVKWHDGEDFNADDVIFTFTSIADPDYVTAGGVRVDYVNSLVGYEEYSSGEADEFEGIEKIDDYTVKFTFAEPNVKALADTAFAIIPEHVFADIPVAEIPENAASREAGEVVGTGPFKLADYMEGEQYILEANEDYYQGAPHLETITWKTVGQSVAGGMLENGELDYIPRDLAPQDAASIEELEGIELFEQPQLGYQYMGFKLHHGPDESLSDKDTWEVNEKLESKELRQAIAYAFDRQAIVGDPEAGNGLLGGRGIVLDAPFPEASWAYNPDAIEGYEHDPAKAEEVLEAAGYVDTNDDGFREDPDGNELVLNLDYPVGNETREKMAPVIQQDLEAVGLKVELRTPREAPAHFDLVEQNNTDVDLYLAGWSLDAGDPDPSSLYKSTAPYNYPRWDNEASDQLLDDAVNPEFAFEQDYRQEKYVEWAQNFVDELPVLPVYSENEIHAWNSKLTNVTIKPFTFKDDTHLWQWTE